MEEIFSLSVSELNEAVAVANGWKRRMVGTAEFYVNEHGVLMHPVDEWNPVGSMAYCGDLIDNLFRNGIGVAINTVSLMPDAGSEIIVSGYRFVDENHKHLSPDILPAITIENGAESLMNNGGWHGLICKAICILYCLISAAGEIDE